MSEIKLDITTATIIMILAAFGLGINIGFFIQIANVQYYNCDEAIK